MENYKDIEEHAIENNVPEHISKGIMLQNNWCKGKQVTQEEFLKAYNVFMNDYI